MSCLEANYEVSSRGKGKKKAKRSHPYKRKLKQDTSVIQTIMQLVQSHRKKKVMLTFVLYTTTVLLRRHHCEVWLSKRILFPTAVAVITQQVRQHSIGTK
jgi:hypothetical protein